MTPRNTLAASVLALVAAAPALSAEESILTALPVQRTAWVENYNPFNQSTRLPSVVDFVYEQLVIFNRFQGGEANFRLATGYEFSDDLTSVTVTLRDGVKWSDGEAFDADDVKFTFDMVAANEAIDNWGVASIVDSVEAVDPLTVRFNLTKPNSQAMYQITRTTIVPEHVWASVEDPVAFTNPNPVGNGPLTDFRRVTAQEYLQCRNETYWDADSLHVDCMRFPQIATNDQALAAAARGELDWMGSFLPDIEKTYVAKDPDNHKYWLPGGSMVFFNMNFETENEGNREAFNDINFRRAVSMAFDRDAMVEIAGYGYPTINQYPSGLGRAYHSWNNPQVDADYGQYMQTDLDAAKALLAEAGYADTDGDGFIETPSGKEIDFDVIVPNGWTDWVNTCQIAVEGLNALGVDASVATPEAALWTDQLMNGDYDFSINAVTVGTTPYDHFERALHIRNADSSRFAAGRYRNQDLSDKLDEFTQTADLDEQKAIIADAEMMIAEDMPWVPVFNNPLWYQFNTKRFTGFFDADNPVGNPVVHDTTNPGRVLHLLALRPVAPSN